jgi:transcriptional regulator of NAD metabolism
MMQSSERRARIEAILKESNKPVSATNLASLFDVSRQVIVGDVALLRASGLDIQATPRGYALTLQEDKGFVGIIACRHTKEAMQTELYTIIDNGGSILDVVVDHPIYGQLVGQLQIFSRYDADHFLRQIEVEQAQPLSRITDGIHLHHIRCQDEAAFGRIHAALEKIGVLYLK